ncbi:hypothetical protein FPQ18DRAFT_240610, partial [Pyronema domesticum]
QVNWQHPITWPLIDTMAKRCQFKARDIERKLKFRYANEGLFDTLQCRTIQHWIEPGTLAWKASVLLRVSNEAARMKPKHTNKELLDGHDEVIEYVTRTLTGMRAVGLPVNAGTARNVIIRIIRGMKPSILTT